MGFLDSLGSILPSLAPIANQFLNQNSTNAANSGAAAGLNAYKNLTLPQIQQLLYTANQSTAANPYNAAQTGAASVGSNAYNNLNINPTAQAEELAAMQQLQGIADSNGLTPQTQAQLQQIRLQQQQTNQGNNGAILQNAQSRGLGDSQLNIAAQLAANQQGANSAAEQGAIAAGNQQQQQLNALNSAAALGGQVYGQQYNQAATTAAAQNALNAYNASNQQQSNLANQNATNTALNQGVANQQQTNLANQNATNTASQNNATNLLSTGNQALAQAGGISTAGQNVATQQNLQNKLNTQTLSPALGQFFGSPGTNGTQGIIGEGLDQLGDEFS
jgi:hypothetical protein